VNVTALPYSPYWSASEEDGEELYKGTDYELIKALSRALNFNVNVMKSENWGEVSLIVTLIMDF